MNKLFLMIFILLLFPISAYAFGRMGLEFGGSGVNKTSKIIYVYLIGADGKNLLGADSAQLLGVGK